MPTAQLLDSYPLAPGCDYITGGSTPGRVVDTGLTIDRLSTFGRLYLSEQTVGNYARLLGWISPDDFADLAADLDEAHEQIAALTDKLGKLDRIREAMADAGFATVDMVEREERAVEEAATEPAVEDEDQTPVGPSGEYPEHQGSGWYLLSNGEKVRGEDEAISAEAALHDWDGEG